MIEPKVLKPDCYKCKAMRRIPGDAHIECRHKLLDPFWNSSTAQLTVFANLAAGRPSPMLELEYMTPDHERKLSVVFDETGIANSWANWPVNFDPTWLKYCIF